LLAVKVIGSYWT